MEYHLTITRNECLKLWMELKGIVLFSCSVVFHSLQPHGLQHIKLPFPPPSPRAYSDSCPLSQWCHPTISSSVIPSPSFNLSQHLGLFLWVSSLHQVGKVLEIQLQHQSFQGIFRIDFLQDGLVWSPCSPMDCQESSPTPQFKASILQGLALFMVQLSHPYMTTGKGHYVRLKYQKVTCYMILFI